MYVQIVPYCVYTVHINLRFKTVPHMHGQVTKLYQTQLKHAIALLPDSKQTGLLPNGTCKVKDHLHVT